MHNHQEPTLLGGRITHQANKEYEGSLALALLQLQLRRLNQDRPHASKLTDPQCGVIFSIKIVSRYTIQGEP